MTARTGPNRMASLVAAAILAAAATGCHQVASKSKEHATSALLDSGPDAKLGRRGTADVEFALGKAREAEGQPQEARTAYLAAAANDPKRADVQARLAILADRQGDVAEADRRFKKALELAPKDAEILADRGYQLYLHRRWAESETALRAAIAARRDHPRAHNNLGLVLASQGEPDKALAEFARAGCDEADARSNLALILAAEGQTAAARDEYARALAAKPGSPTAREGLRVAELALSRANGLPDLPTTRVAAKAAPVDPALARTSAVSSPPGR